MTKTERMSVPARAGSTSKKVARQLVPVAEPVSAAVDAAVELAPRSLDVMSHAQLRQYAARLGITARDIAGLSEARLRQNCKVRIFTAMED